MQNSLPLGKFRLFRSIISALCIVIILLGGYFWINRKQHLESFLSKQLNATVLISEVSMKFRGITLEEVNISSPLKTSPFMVIDKIDVEFPIWNIFRNHIKATNLKLLNPKMYFELVTEDGKENTMSIFLDNLPKKSSKQFTIKNIYLYNVEFHSHDASGKSFNVWPIGYLDIDNAEVNQTLAQLTHFIFSKIESNMISSYPLPFKNITP